MSATLVLLRHGQSVYNQKNLFTGFLDVELSDHGRIEAKSARDLLKNYKFDAVFTSKLKRAKDTADIVLENNTPKDYFSSQALNERHYGQLQGQNKDQARAQFGADQVNIWRRSYDTAPPDGESLKDTCERVWQYFDKNIKNKLLQNQTILITAHGNSLRALVMLLEKLTPEQIMQVEIPTCEPIVYTLDNQLHVQHKIILGKKS